MCSGGKTCGGMLLHIFLVDYVAEQPMHCELCRGSAQEAKLRVQLSDFALSARLLGWDLRTTASGSVGRAVLPRYTPTARAWRWGRWCAGRGG